MKYKKSQLKALIFLAVTPSLESKIEKLMFLDYKYFIYMNHLFMRIQN